MRSIKKLKSTGKAVAGSALLVGATLTGAAGFAAAQDSGDMNLGDYPAPFVNDDGEVDSTIVIGSQGRQADVVGAINVAGSLGNAAFSESEESVSVEGSFGWSATNGVSLDTQNDQLFFGQNIDEVRQTLTEDQLPVLETMEVLSGDAQQDVEQYLYLGSQGINYGTPGDTDGEEDPFLYVNNPSNVDVANGDYLYRLQANFEDGVEFLDDGQDDDRNDDVYGEEVSMFGMDFTVADESFYGSNSGQLVLYGSQEEVDVTNGESSTVTVDGEEYTVETVAVTGSDAAAVRIDGTLEQVETNDEFDVGGETLRVDSIIDTGDNGAGVVQFAIGSEQVVLEDEEPVMIGSDEEEVDGTEVVLSGSNVESGDVGSATDVQLSSVEVGVGADDTDNEYVREGETFEDPVFNDVEFHFGGLNPDAASEDAEGVGTVEFATDGDDTATVSFESGEESVTQGFMYDSDLASNSNGASLAADSDEEIRVVEGQALQEDEYFVSDAGDFSHMWQVTGIDADSTGSNIEESDEATVELEDSVTGASVEVDLDAYDQDSTFTSNNDVYYRGEEVIDGQSYYFEVNDAGDTAYVAWDSAASFGSGDNAAGTLDLGDRISTYGAVDTESDAAVSFMEAYDFTTHPSASSGGLDITAGDASSDSSVTLELPSTESTDAQTVTADFNFEGAGSGSDTVVIGGNTVYDGSGSGSESTTDVTAGEITYTVEYDVDASGGDVSAADIESIEPAATAAPSAAVIQPEDDSDNEEAYVVTPGNDQDDEEVDVGGSQGSIAYTGDDYAADYSSTTKTLESDDDVEAGYNVFGTYTEQDTDDQGSFTLHLPSAQATAGAAVTGAEGSLEASASGGSGTVTTQTPTGFPDAAALDSEVSGSDRNQNMILVGGPAVNTLTEELASENKTWTADEYEEDTWVLDLVEGFSEDTHALVVAGYGAEDTQAASSYISNYADNQEELAGESRVSMTTSASQ